VITLNKYRKAHKLLQEVEGSRSTPDIPAAGLAVKSGQGQGQGQGVKDSRSMSVTREITRVVRV